MPLIRFRHYVNHLVHNNQKTWYIFSATAEEYRASIYALSTFCVIGDLKFAESAMKYLFYHSHMLDRHPEMLYSAVKAFAKYDALLNDRHRALTISLATSGMELTDTLELKPEKPLQVLHLPSLPTKVFVYATGAGCATIQVNKLKSENLGLRSVVSKTGAYLAIFVFCSRYSRFYEQLTKYDMVL